MEGKKGVKVLVVLMVSIMFVEGSNVVGDYGSCFVECLKDGVFTCILEPEECLPGCALKCAIFLPASPPTAAANYACNIGCTLRQCKNFMMLNDGKNLGGCMASCSDNYCAKKAAVI